MKNRCFRFYILLFTLINLVVINGLVYFVGQDNSQLHNIRDIAVGKPSFTDSWEPMARAVIIARQGDDPTIYQTVFFEQKNKFQYPPTSLLIFDLVLKASGSFGGTKAVFDWISIISLWGTIIISIFLFSKTIGRDYPGEYQRKSWLVSFLIILMGLMFFPLNKAFELGQIQIWLDFLFALSLLFWVNNKQFNSGICIGLIAIIKPQMGLFLFWGALRRKWSFCLGIIGVAVTGLGFSLAQYGMAAHLKYVEVLQFIGQRGETYYPNQSINGLLNRLIQNGNNLKWDALNFAPKNTIVMVITSFTSIVILMLGLFLTRKKDAGTGNTTSWISYSVAAIAFTVASPVAWEHHYGIIFPIFALITPLVYRLRTIWKSGLILTGVSYVLVSNQYLFLNLTSQTVFNFLQSYLFFGVLVLLGVLLKMISLTGVENTSMPTPGADLLPD